VKALKVSLNEDYTSRGYGFICFEDKEAAKKALDSKKENFSVKPLEPKTTHHMRKIINNIYVKNIPKEWT
jgi:RNA recognition motif-containing protein